MNPKLVALGLFILCLFAPNVLWLTHSTARITNAGTAPLKAVTVYVDDTARLVGTLAPGESDFIFLPKKGDATYRVLYLSESGIRSACNEYVEESMYHIETRLAGDDACTVSLPITRDLLIRKLF